MTDKTFMRADEVAEELDVSKAKLKRGFATKKEALAWEREFLMEKQADVNMTFESFVSLYEMTSNPN